MITRLPALSLKQPWATLMALQEKLVETRQYRYSMVDPFLAGGPVYVAIHASRTWRPDQVTIMGTEPFASRLRWHGITADTATHATLPRGGVVGVGRCVRVEHDTIDVSEKERAFGHYGPGRWFYVFDRVWTVWANEQRFMVRGQLGAWSLTEQETRTVLVGLQHHEDLPDELASDELAAEAVAILREREKVSAEVNDLLDRLKGKRRPAASPIELAIDRAVGLG